MSELKIAFWNLQNLFDVTVSKIAADLDFTPANGWDEQAFRAKITALARVIRSLHDGHGPDLLGICEIENEGVAEKLIAATGRCDYALAHIDSPDIRGIDTSLIYSTEKFELIEPPNEHLVHLRFPTRDIFEVRLRVRANNQELIVLVNHWPSRSRGRYETEAYRLTVASHAGRVVDGLLKYNRPEYFDLVESGEASDVLEVLNQRWNRNVLLMGDFNDEPFDRSVLEFLRASKGVDHLEEPIKLSRGGLPSYKSYSGKRASLFNCMWSQLARPDHGTHYFSGGTNTMNTLDQFMVSRALYFGLKGLQLHWDEDGTPAAWISKPDVMTTRKGRPRAFDRKTKNGYSDHFPIEMLIDVISGT